MVSIPFKRESLSKAVDNAFACAVCVLWVSIPFKRESLSKAFMLPAIFPAVWVSIPFKRESLSKADKTEYDIEALFT